jgi:RES domain-containing protein
MTRLPAALGGGDGLVVWRLDQRIRAASWDSGEGAFREGGRWNSKGARAVYCSIDAATAILEVAVHKGFKTLDTMPYVITAARIADIAEVHVVKRDAVPNPNWLRPV